MYIHHSSFVLILKRSLIFFAFCCLPPSIFSEQNWGRYYYGTWWCCENHHYRSTNWRGYVPYSSLDRQVHSRYIYLIANVTLVHWHRYSNINPNKICDLFVFNHRKWVNIPTTMSLDLELENCSISSGVQGHTRILPFMFALVICWYLILYHFFTGEWHVNSFLKLPVRFLKNSL